MKVPAVVAVKQQKLFSFSDQQQGQQRAAVTSSSEQQRAAWRREADSTHANPTQGRSAGREHAGPAGVHSGEHLISIPVFPWRRRVRVRWCGRAALDR